LGASVALAAHFFLPQANNLREMSFNISSSFVSREVLDEQGNAKQIEWDKVRSEAEQGE
jgi:hypothetical protein